MKKTAKFASVAALVLAAAMTFTACSSSSSSAAPETKASETEASETEAADTTADLNSKTLDEIIAAAKEEGDVQSVGMPDSWANWGSMWTYLGDTYGLTHTDIDMSSSEELQMFATEGENGTKDIGDVGQAFGNQAIEEDLVQGYKTSYWDSVPDWAKGEDGKWMIAYTGATTFLINNDILGDDPAPTSWQDIRDASYKISIGPLTGGNGQAAFIAANFAFGGDLTNLDPGIEFFTELAEAGRLLTIDIVQDNFAKGEIPVGVVWSFTAIPYKNAITNYNMSVAIPSDGSIMSGYASVINKYAPHPNAAALARETIFSDEGQAFLAESGAIPTRTDVEIPEEIQEATFHQADYANAIPMQDTAAYSDACANAATRWDEEVKPLIVE
ncbi:MAG: ABC transporter substrate-binding protein [Lachnospiraceae bacterium]|nr:ABC transporter substrate-binding protein [Lachnospiraceae bacterium]